MKFAILAFLPLFAYAQLREPLRKRIDEAVGAQGAYDATEDVHRVTFPRNDVKVTVDNWQLHPFMGITSWAAFTSGSAREVMVMGDLVLFEDEVNPVMSAALDNGLEVTALHNHFFYDQPRVMFMHIGGEGAADQLARAVRKCLDRVKEVRSSQPAPASNFPGAAVAQQSAINSAEVEKILGVKGQSNNGMFKVSLGRSARMHGRAAGNLMGVNTWAAFAGTPDLAYVDGDFAMLESELQIVLKSLRSSGINIVAIHNHMVHEEPQYVFLHYWGKGKAADLARALRKTLDQQAKASAVPHASH